MNLNQLKIFYFAVKHGSFSAAAQALSITQPAVTKQIQELHAAYGIRFLNRFGKKMVLTDAGETLYEIAAQIFQIEAQAEEKIRDFQQRRTGRLRIQASESFGAYYLPHILHLFKKTHPRIFVSAIILPTEQVVENTLRLENDVGFISSFHEDPRLVVRVVLEDRLVLAVPQGHPFARLAEIEPKQIDGQPLIIHEKGSATREIIDAFLARHGLTVSITLELSNNEAIKRAVEQGMGISLVSRHVAKEEVRQRKLQTVPIRDASLKRKFYLVHHKDKYLSQSLQGLITTADRWTARFAAGKA